MRLLFVLALMLALLVTVFAVQNNANIDVSFLFWGVAGSLALVLMITLWPLPTPINGAPPEAGSPAT